MDRRTGRGGEGKTWLNLRRLLLSPDQSTLTDVTHAGGQTRTSRSSGSAALRSAESAQGRISTGVPKAVR